MRLEDLCSLTPGAKIRCKTNVEPKGVSHDSREVQPGDLFVCLVGEKFNGHKFAADAMARGAVAIVSQNENSVPAGLPGFSCPDTRLALPSLACAIYGNPSHQMKLIGIAGTNGKTTSIYLVSSILNAAGWRTGTIGTLGTEVMGENLPSAHTTPEADQLQALLARMHQRKAEGVVMEVSSHAIAMNRTRGCAFDCAVFTNLTQDHLDFHGTMDAYFDVKQRLFTEYAEESGKPFFASVNIDDPRGALLSKAVKGRIISFGVHSEADVTAQNIDVRPDSTSFIALTPLGRASVNLSICGAFQVYNALGAIGVGVGFGIPPEVIAQGLASLKAVPGRFESVPTGKGFSVVVDYAHTPDGLENLLQAARSLHPARVVLVFGCGGDRDRGKRPIMGNIAARYADIAILTSDNPRTEDPLAIIKDVLPGMDNGSAKCFVEPDRHNAIALAIDLALDGDIILLAGKGHENYQIVGEDILPFDDRIEAMKILNA